MISTETLLQFLYERRRDKLALVLLMGFMGGDSVIEAWMRLDDWMPKIKELEKGSQKVRKPNTKKFDIDHDLALRVKSLAEDIEPWLRQLAELESKEKLETTNT